MVDSDSTRTESSAAIRSDPGARSQTDIEKTAIEDVILVGRPSIEQMLKNARSARLVDGADEVHLTQIAKHVIDAFRGEGSTRRATGLGLLF